VDFGSNLTIIDGNNFVDNNQPLRNAEWAPRDGRDAQ
jgi:hypothetical protein